MKVEMLTRGNIEQVLNDNNISFNKRYSGDTYKIIELEKHDAKRICNGDIDTNGAWCMTAVGGAGGSLFDLVTINKESLIGWSAKKESYNKLTDYLSSLGATDDTSICNYAASLSRANGWSLSKLFNMCEG